MPKGRRRRTPEEFVERFWKLVDIREDDDCWLFQGRISPFGYGQICSYEMRIEQAHRYAYMISVGPIPPKICVCHKCDVRNCVNPKHLFLGTRNDNIQDMWNKKRGRVGSSIPGHKLSESDIPEIFAKHKVGISMRGIGRHYHVSLPTIREILFRRAWKHVSENIHG